MGAAPDPGEDYAPWKPDQLLAHRYRVHECLQPIGSCKLHRVQDVFRGELQLVVRPSPRVLAIEAGEAWFDDYAKRTLSMPAHPNMLPCTRMDRAGAVPFLVMANVDGVCWDRAISSGRLTNLNHMLDVAMQVGRGLAWLHAGGHVHGNVKPANVLVTLTHVAKIWKYPQIGARTRAYASPEQLAAKTPPVPSTDIWSWAVSVLHMFVSEVAWPEGPDAAAALERYTRRGPARKGISLMPGPLVDVLAECLQADPSQRPGSMDDIVSALRNIIENVVDEAPGGLESAAARAAEQAAGPPPETEPAAEAPDVIEVRPLDEPDAAGADSELEALEADLELEPDAAEDEGGADDASEPRPHSGRWTARKEPNPPHRPRPRGGGRRPHSR